MGDEAYYVREFPGRWLQVTEQAFARHEGEAAYADDGDDLKEKIAEIEQVPVGALLAGRQHYNYGRHGDDKDPDGLIEIRGRALEHLPALMDWAKRHQKEVSYSGTTAIRDLKRMTDSEVVKFHHRQLAIGNEYMIVDFVLAYAPAKVESALEQQRERETKGIFYKKYRKSKIKFYDLLHPMASHLWEVMKADKLIGSQVGYSWNRSGVSIHYSSRNRETLAYELPGLTLVCWRYIASRKYRTRFWWKTIRELYEKHGDDILMEVEGFKKFVHKEYKACRKKFRRKKKAATARKARAVVRRSTSSAAC